MYVRHIYKVISVHVELIHTILIVDNKLLYLLTGVTGPGLHVQSRILAHIYALHIHKIETYAISASMTY